MSDRITAAALGAAMGAGAVVQRLIKDDSPTNFPSGGRDETYRKDSHLLAGHFGAVVWQDYYNGFAGGKRPAAELPIGISGYYFDLSEKEKIEFGSDITDFYAEDNTSLQDNIALPPEKITLTGIVSEITNSPLDGTPYYKQANIPSPSTFAWVRAFQGNKTEEQQKMFERDSIDAKQVEERKRWDDRNGAYYTWSNSMRNIGQADYNYSPLRQYRAMNYFYYLRNTRCLVTVQTVGGIWKNMALENFTMEQDPNNEYNSRVTAVFKRMRFAGAIALFREGEKVNTKVEQENVVETLAEKNKRADEAARKTRLMERMANQI